MANTFRNEVYRSPKTLSYIVIGRLASLALSGALYIFLSLALIFFPDTQFDLGDGDSIQVPLAFLGLVGLVEIPLRLLTIVFFLVWEYRAFNNLSALKARSLEFSPGWTVGWWFIPFAKYTKTRGAFSKKWFFATDAAADAARFQLI